MGDHCYMFDQGGAGGDSVQGSWETLWNMTADRRGDAYMNVFQPVLRGCPWVPVIGNHEMVDRTNKVLGRYTAMTRGEVVGHGASDGRSTATIALGQHLALGNFYAAGSHGTIPSNTSRYYSVNLGLIHIAAMDLMSFWPDWPKGDPAQVAWLEEDLKAANANRGKVPWIIVTSHPAIYTLFTDLHANMSAASYLGISGEFRNRYKPCTEEGCKTIGEWRAEIRDGIHGLEPILLKHGVDLYNAGHVHDYESSWPAKGGEACQKNFDNPTCPVYVVDGSGGVPGENLALDPGRNAPPWPDQNCAKENVSGYCGPACKNFTVDHPNGFPECTAYSWCRSYWHGTGYGIVTAIDANTLRYDHVCPTTGRVADTFTIKQKRHGPFAPLPTQPPGPPPPPTPLPPTPPPQPGPAPTPGKDCFIHNELYTGPRIDDVQVTSARDCQAQCQKNAQCHCWSCNNETAIGHCEWCLRFGSYSDLAMGTGWISGPRQC